MNDFDLSIDFLARLGEHFLVDEDKAFVAQADQKVSRQSRPHTQLSEQLVRWVLFRHHLSLSFMNADLNGPRLMLWSAAPAV